MTSIEWLISRLAHNDILDHKKLSENKQLYNLYQRLKQQAEEMHKQEIIDAFSHTEIMSGEYFQVFDNAEEYYEKTFKQPKQ